jgi:prophage regulatory protein
MSASNPKIIRLDELISMTGLARSTLYDIQNPKSPRFDPSFPKKIKLSLRAVGFFLEDVIAWLNNRKTGAEQSKEVTQ